MHSNRTPLAGLYVHIPFCIRKCPYCDFYSVTDTALETAFLTALQKEMRMRKAAGLTFDTLCLGGGTPSVLAPSSIDSILQTAHRCFAISDDAEITIEVNPGSVNAARLRDYRRAGINRLNVGVQSFQDDNLNFLGRIHSAADAKAVLRQARRAGFDNIGLDLIYGLPAQLRQDWLRDLESAADFQPEHLSCYMLTFEAGTPLDRKRQSGSVQPLPDDRLAELFEITLQDLASRAYHQYEISNFARRPLHCSRHNQKYWDFVSYLGFGPSAHSFAVPARRSWNYRSLRQYIAALEDGLPPTAAEELLTHEQRMIEMIYLGLRQTEGIDVRRFRQSFGVDLTRHCGQTVESLRKARYLETSRTHCFLTRRGQMLLDSVAGRLIQALQ